MQIDPVVVAQHRFVTTVIAEYSVDQLSFHLPEKCWAALALLEQFVEFPAMA
jgi:hypothetical protein